MPVSGWVVSLSSQPQLRTAALTWIDQQPQLTRGTLLENQLPLVADTASIAADRQLWAELQSLPGVRFIDVAFVAFDDDSPNVGSVAPGSSSSLISAGSTGKENTFDGR